MVNHYEFSGTDLGKALIGHWLLKIRPRLLEVLPLPFNFPSTASQSVLAFSYFAENPFVSFAFD